MQMTIMEVLIAPSPFDMVESWTFKKTSSQRKYAWKIKPFCIMYALLVRKVSHHLWGNTVHFSCVKSLLIHSWGKLTEEFFYGVLSNDSLVLFYWDQTEKRVVVITRSYVWKKGKNETQNDTKSVRYFGKRF